MVLKLKGRSINVAGSSLSTSTNTMSTAVRMELRIKGTWILRNMSNGL